MPKTFDFQARGTYYRRHRTLPVLRDGQLSEPERAMITRWGYQHSRYRRPHDAYVLPDGTWCEIRNVPTELGEDGQPLAWAHAFVPCQSRELRDRHASQTEERGDVPPCVISVKDGRAHRVTGAAGTAWDGQELADVADWAYLAALLGVC